MFQRTREHSVERKMEQSVTDTQLIIWVRRENLSTALARCSFWWFSDLNNSTTTLFWTEKFHFNPFISISNAVKVMWFIELLSNNHKILPEVA